MMFSFFNKVNSAYDKLAYEFNFNGIDGNLINLMDYKGKVIVVVNVASRCGFINMKIYKIYGLIIKIII